MTDSPVRERAAAPSRGRAGRAALGHIEDAVSLYLKFTDVDPETARQVVEKLAEG